MSYNNTCRAAEDKHKKKKNDFNHEILNGANTVFEHLVAISFVSRVYEILRIL